MIDWWRLRLILRKFIFSLLNKLSLELQINLFPQTSRGFLFPYHRNDVKMFKTQVAPQVQSFEHNDV